MNMVIYHHPPLTPEDAALPQEHKIGADCPPPKDKTEEAHVAVLSPATSLTFQEASGLAKTKRNLHRNTIKPNALMSQEQELRNAEVRKQMESLRALQVGVM